MGCNESIEQAVPLTKAKSIDIRSLTKNAGGLDKSPKFKTKDIVLDDLALGPNNSQKDRPKEEEEQEY